jgi:hypothetical protein
MALDDAKKAEIEIGLGRRTRSMRLPSWVRRGPEPTTSEPLRSSATMAKYRGWPCRLNSEDRCCGVDLEDQARLVLVVDLDRVVPAAMTNADAPPNGACSSW